MMREEFPILNKMIYFDNASFGAIPRSVEKSVKQLLDRYADLGEDWGYVLERLNESKGIISSMLKVKPENIAAQANVSTCMAAILTSIKYKPGCNVVLSQQNFPSSFHMFLSLKMRGFISEIRVVPYDDGIGSKGEMYEKFIDDSTAVVCVDAVGWLTGYVEEVRYISEIAHEHGATFFSDIFHAAGVIPLDLKRMGIDAAAFGMYKWLLGQHGLAFLYVSDELLDVLPPGLLSWFSIEDSIIDRAENGEHPFTRHLPLLDARPSRTARRYEWGSLSDLAVVAGNAALKLLKTIDEYSRYRAINEVVSELRRGLLEMGCELYSPIEPNATSGIVSVKSLDAHGVATRLKERGIACSARPGILRFSPHFFNTRSEAVRVIEELNEINLLHP